MLPVSPTSIPEVEWSTNANSGMSMTPPQPQPFSPPTMFSPSTPATPHSTPDQGTLQSSAVLLLLKASRALAGTCAILSTVFLSLGMVFGVAKPAFAHEDKVFKICNTTPNPDQTANYAIKVAFGAWMSAPANSNITGLHNYTPYDSSGERYEINPQLLINWAESGFWYSKGWFIIHADNCIQVARGHEFGRYVYLHVAGVNHTQTFGDGRMGIFCVNESDTSRAGYQGFFVAEYDKPITIRNNNYYYVEFKPQAIRTVAPLSKTCRGFHDVAFSDERARYSKQQFHGYDIGDSNTSFTWNINRTW